MLSDLKVFSKTCKNLWIIWRFIYEDPLSHSQKDLILLKRWRHIWPLNRRECRHTFKLNSTEIIHLFGFVWHFPITLFIFIQKIQRAISLSRRHLFLWTMPSVPLFVHEASDLQIYSVSEKHRELVWQDRPTHLGTTCGSNLDVFLNINKLKKTLNSLCRNCIENLKRKCGF